MNQTAPQGRIVLRLFFACFMAGAAYLGVGADVAIADHNTPRKAKNLKAELVTSYLPCTTPNTTGGGLPACTPPERSNPSCGFGPVGSGKFILAVQRRPNGIRPKLILRGLDAGCEGKTLRLRFTTRVTYDNCGGASCTLEEEFGAEGTDCLVANGRCTGMGSFTFQEGLLWNLAIVDCGVFEVADALVRTFDCGLLVP
jgi:hypothetical protein